MTNNLYHLFSITCSVILLTFQTAAFAAEKAIPGNITFYNESGKNVTAEVHPFGKVNLTPKAEKQIAYSTLQKVCSANPTHCKAHFYVNNAPAGSATINTVTGKLVDMNLTVDVSTRKSQQILRAVIIK